MYGRTPSIRHRPQWTVLQFEVVPLHPNIPERTAQDAVSVAITLPSPAGWEIADRSARKFMCLLLVKNAYYTKLPVSPLSRSKTM